MLQWATFTAAALGTVTGVFATVWAITVGRAREVRDKQLEQAWQDAARAREHADAAEHERQLWERDRVNEHYLALLRASQEFNRVVVEVVQPIFMTAPTGDDADAWAKLTTAHGGLIAKVQETMVVARDNIAPSLGLLSTLDVYAMVPIPHDKGLPKVAWERHLAEYHAFARIHAHLPVAMSADLGLTAADAQMPIDVGPRSSRELTGDAARLRELLREFRVQPDEGASDTFDHPDPAIFDTGTKSRRPMNATFGIAPNTRTAMSFSVRADLDDPLKLLILRQAVRYVESGLRDGPDQRTSANGGRFAFWNLDGSWS